jgi:hypothetical protein
LASLAPVTVLSAEISTWSATGSTPHDVPATWADFIALPTLPSWALLRATTLGVAPAARTAVASAPCVMVTTIAPVDRSRYAPAVAESPSFFTTAAADLAAAALGDGLAVVACAAGATRNAVTARPAAETISPFRLDPEILIRASCGGFRTRPYGISRNGLGVGHSTTAGALHPMDRASVPDRIQHLRTTEARQGTTFA